MDNKQQREMPEIMPPRPEIEPQRDTPEIPADKDAPEKKTPVQGAN
jgi:hypothetical protein